MDNYVASIVKDFTEEFNPTREFNTPGATGPPPTRSTKDDSIIEMEKFRSYVGRVMFASGKTEPTTSTACRELSSHLTAPNEEHWKALSHLIGYAKTGAIQGFKLRPPIDRRVVAFVDADYSADRNDRKSISGFLVTIGRCLVSWGSKKQSGVTLSTTEAEFVAMSVAATEIKFVVSLLSEIGKGPPLLPSILREDNTGAIFMAKNTAIGQRTKHVDIRYRFVNDMILAKDLSVTHIASGQNPSDVMTKNLPHASFSIHEKMIKDGNLGSLYDPRNTEDVKPSRATVAFASVSSDSTLRTIAFDSSARHGTETMCSGGPALTKIDEDNRDDSGWVLVLPKPKKPFPGKLSRVGKGANETLGTATIRAIPMCKGYSHYLESKPNNFCAPVREPKFEKFGG